MKSRYSMAGDHDNPNIVPETGTFYFASDVQYEEDAIIRKGSEDNDACLCATDSMDECMVLDGFGHIYQVRGTTCRHYRSPDVSYSIQNIYGGYYTGVKNHADFPPTAHQFDELVVIREIPGDEFFGPNGAQVLHVIKWIRSKFLLIGDELKPIGNFGQILDSIHMFYRDRLLSAKWPRLVQEVDFLEQLVFNPKQLTVVRTSKFWLQPWKLAAAWGEAYSTAISEGRVNRCDWFMPTFPSLIGLTLRDKLHSRFFDQMYAGLEPYYPLATLDSEVKGILYKA